MLPVRAVELEVPSGRLKEVLNCLNFPETSHNGHVYRKLIPSGKRLYSSLHSALTHFILSVLIQTQSFFIFRRLSEEHVVEVGQWSGV